jgi:hypothetical protein
LTALIAAAACWLAAAASLKLNSPVALRGCTPRVCRGVVKDLPALLDSESRARVSQQRPARQQLCRSCANPRPTER